jgi:hypothetical protein
MSAHSLLVGPEVDANPARMPGDATFNGRFGSVERLSAERHGAELWRAMAGHEYIYTYIPVGPFVGPAAFAAYVEQCEHDTERVFYAVLDPAGRALGILALM